MAPLKLILLTASANTGLEWATLIEMNKVLKFGFSFGLLGYAIAVLMQILAVRFLVSSAVIRVFVPITNLTMMFPVNISWTSVLILIGPINAIVYFLLGTLVGAVYAVSSFRGIRKMMRGLTTSF